MAALPSLARRFADLITLLTKKRKEKPLSGWSGLGLWHGQKDNWQRMSAA
tara:strand:- start:63548 stop:63697 length:150 start_codon:yes stop_codon:yes gene_type:complete